MQLNDEGRIKVNGFKKYFWDHENMPFDEPTLRIYYSQNLERWIQNAHHLRNNFPVETNFLLTYIYKSDFSFKLIQNNAKFNKRKKRYTPVEKISLLNNAFEHGYQHFAFLTVCEHYTPEFIQHLHSKWFIPDSAREFTDNIEVNPWKDKSGQFISGKKWIVENCPLYTITPSSVNVDLIRIIKNATSHEKLAFVEKGIAVFENDKKERLITYKELNHLFRFVQCSVNLALHFNMSLAIRHSFWFTPGLILCNPAKFNFKRPTVPSFELLKNNKKVKKKKKGLGDGIFSEKASLLAICSFEYFFETIWKRISEDKATINRFLNKYDLEFDESKFKEIYNNMLFETFSALIISHDKIKVLVLKEEVNEPSFVILKADVPNFDYYKLIDAFMKMLKKVKEEKSVDKGLSTLIQIGLGLMLSLVAVWENMSEALKTVCKNKLSNEQLW